MRKQLFAVLTFLVVPFVVPSQTVPEQPSTAPLPTPAQDSSRKFILPCDTPAHLSMSQDFNQKNTSVGDKVPLVLRDDLMAGNMLFAKKGSPVEATVVELIPSRPGGLPGIVRFEVHSFLAGNTTVFLRGHATREGELKTPGASVLIPAVGPFTALRRGGDPVIKKGTPFTAYLAQDALLAPLS
jgi:hypothetical protein